MVCPDIKIHFRASGQDVPLLNSLLYKDSVLIHLSFVVFESSHVKSTMAAFFVFVLKWKG